LRGGAGSVGQREEDEKRKREGEADRRGPGVSVVGKKKKERRSVGAECGPDTNQ
jgi:hypothetical protein